MLEFCLIYEIGVISCRRTRIYLSTVEGRRIRFAIDSLTAWVSRENDGFWDSVEPNTWVPKTRKNFKKYITRDWTQSSVWSAAASGTFALEADPVAHATAQHIIAVLELGRTTGQKTQSHCGTRTAACTACCATARRLRHSDGMSPGFIFFFQPDVPPLHEFSLVLCSS